MARDDEMMTPGGDAADVLVPTWTTDRHLDEGTIHAWLDDAFDASQAAVVAAHVDACERCRESVAEARGFIAGASRMVRALDAVPSGVVPQEDVERVAARIVAAASVDAVQITPIAARARGAWYTRSVVRSAAAVLVMVAGGGYLLSRGPEDSVQDIGSRVVDSVSRASASAPVVAPSAPPVADASSVRERLAERPIVAERGGKRAVQPQSLSSAKSEAAPSVANAADAVVADTARAKLMKSDVAQGAAVSVARAPLPSAPVATPVSTMSDRGAPGRTAVVGTDSARAFQRSMVAGGVARMPIGASAAIGRMDSASTVCWTLRSTDNAVSLAATEKDDVSNLPVGLANGEFSPRSVVQVRWLDWPVTGRTTEVQFRMDNADTLTAWASEDGRRLSLSLTRSGGSWIGTAVLRDEGEFVARNSARGVTRPVIMTRADPSVCKR